MFSQYYFCWSIVWASILFIHFILPLYNTIKLNQQITSIPLERTIRRQQAQHMLLNSNRNLKNGIGLLLFFTALQFTITRNHSINFLNELFDSPNYYFLWLPMLILLILIVIISRSLLKATLFLVPLIYFAPFILHQEQWLQALLMLVFLILWQMIAHPNPINPYINNAKIANSKHPSYTANLHLLKQQIFEITKQNVPIYFLPDVDSSMMFFSKKKNSATLNFYVSMNCISQYSAESIKALIAHEWSHFINKDHRYFYGKFMLHLLSDLSLFLLLQHYTYQSIFASQSLGFLISFLLLRLFLHSIFHPFFFLWKGRMELRADQEAMQYPGPILLWQALNGNKSIPTQNPGNNGNIAPFHNSLYNYFHGSHPSMHKRLSRIKEMLRLSGKFDDVI